MSRGAEDVGFRTGLQVDMPLLVGIVAIATLGVVNLYSGTSVYLDDVRRSGMADLYVSQIYWIVVGILAAILVAVLDYRHYERLSYVVYGGGIVALCLVFVLGADVRGASRWIQFGTFTFQPSEFMKILLILVVAKFLQDDPKTEPRNLFDLAPPLALTALPVVLVMAQPDLGTSIVYVLTAFSMLAMTKIRRRTVALLAAGMAILAWIVWTFAMHDYQKGRITSFLDPEKDLAGAAWHALQSRTAIGNGGLTGEGFMQGTQNQFGFLPDQHSDFPFAVFAEDWGFAGSVALLATYCFLCVWSIRVASLAKDKFGAALAIGVGAMLFWHVLANVGMAMGLLPVVGITLPLFSYGGSSALTIMIGFGMLMNVSMRR